MGDVVWGKDLTMGVMDDGLQSQEQDSQLGGESEQFSWAVGQGISSSCKGTRAVCTSAPLCALASQNLRPETANQTDGSLRHHRENLT